MGRQGLAEAMRVHYAAALVVLLCSLALCSGDGDGSMGAAVALAGNEPGVVDLPGVNTTLPEKGSDPVAEPVEEDEEPKEKDKFSKIPFFVFKADAEVQLNCNSAQECVDRCGGMATCKSASWSERKRDCMTSKKALSFNGDFTFFSRRVYSEEKAFGDNRMGNYRRFAGLMYESQEFTRYEEKSEEECKKYCDTAVDGHNRRCNGFSYNENKQICLLSPYGLNYEKDYDYYEKNPEPKIVEEKTTDPKTGLVTITKKEVPVNLDVPLEEAVKPFTETPEYKANLQMQETAAKAGAKELAHKNNNKKEVKHEKKELKEEEMTLQKEEKQEEVQLTKGNDGKEAIARMKAQKEREMAEEEQTQKQYVLMMEKEKEQATKKEQEVMRAKEAAEEKAQAELAAELNVKTEAKRIQMEKDAHIEKQKKKIAVIIRSGRALAIQERKNKDKAFNDEENNAKEKLVKVDVKKVLANRHHKHKKEFEQFVQETTERNMKKRKTDDLNIAQEQLKSMRALVHGLGLEIEKLKAQADGYQHEINTDAKEGKESPKAEVKLSFTMDQIKTEQGREATRRRDILKAERDILQRMDALKKLDGDMTKMGVGRRRRAVADATHAAASDPKKIIMDMPVPKLPAESEMVGGRRRRSKARLMKEYMDDIRQSSSTGETMIPGVPAMGKPDDA